MIGNQDQELQNSTGLPQETPFEFQITLVVKGFDTDLIF